MSKRAEPHTPTEHAPLNEGMLMAARPESKSLLYRFKTARLTGRVYWSVFWAGLVVGSLLGIISGYLYLTSLPVLDLQAAMKRSPIVVDRHDHLLRAFTTEEDRWRLPVAAEDIAPQYAKLLLNFEDKGFYTHAGIEPLALLRAAKQWAMAGHIVSGGSTLTMQVARLIEGHSGRSIAIKLRQMKAALQLETHLTKDEIFSLYLHLTPFGGNIEGVRAASLAYFGKEPKRLSLAEAATLVAIPQSPEMRRPDRFPKRAMRARNRVLKRGYEAGLISEGDYLYARRQPMTKSRLAFPMVAPHLSEQLVPKVGPSHIVRTTISKHLQVKLERLAATHAARLGKDLSAAILLIDHQTGEVLAHVGSADYEDHDRYGPIDMTRSVRSPGSTLKPFIYGMGFDAGLAHPETLIDDAPVRYGLYAPKNFDGKFHGTVSVRQALQKSLNIPAVKMLSAIKPARFSARFRYAGLHKSMPLNLAVALGGVGFTLEDLARSYMHIANPTHVGGLKRFRQAELATSLKRQKERPLMSERAAFYVSHILRGATPPKNAKPGALAYKTGTSYGYRDGWAIGFDGRHLVAVWIGRPDGSATTNLTGIGAAGPLLFDAFQYISEKRAPFAPPPEGVIFANGDELPPPLRHLDKKPLRLLSHQGLRDGGDVKIAFPPPGAEFLMQKRQAGRFQIALKASGGTLPLTWLVNGKMINSKAYRRQNHFKPDERGFIEFSVIDAKGKTDRVQIRVR